MLAKVFLPVIFIFLSIPQLRGQGLSRLDQQKGFKNIRIGDSIQTYPAYFKYEGRADDGYDVYRLSAPQALKASDSLALKWAQYLSIGYIRLDHITLLCYKGKIHEILLSFKPAYFEDMKAVLSKAYGEANERACELIEEETAKRVECAWKGKEIVLWCRLMESEIEGEKQIRSLLGYQNFKMVAKMRKELQKAAVDDLLQIPPKKKKKKAGAAQGKSSSEN